MALSERKSKQARQAAQLLHTYLENGKRYTAEGLAKKFGTSKATIHRAFTYLRQISGWSIRRAMFLHLENVWEPTVFIVTRPQNKISHQEKEEDDC